MGFEVSAEAYGRFMGRYSIPLAAELVKLLPIAPGDRALDVGAGPGALTAELAARMAPDRVSAIDPSTSFVEALRRRFPSVDVRVASAESLPFDDDAFAVTAAQLVVHFMTDPVAGLREMARVTRPGGVVAACVWDQTGDRGPLSAFWRAVRDIEPSADDESGLPGVREGQLADLFRAAGMNQIEPTTLTVRVRHETFEDWWDPYTLGVGPAGAYVAGLAADGRAALRAHCRRSLPQPPFDVTAVAWTVIGRSAP